MQPGAVAMATDAEAINTPDEDEIREVFADGQDQKVSAAALVHALLRPYTVAGFSVDIDVEDVPLRHDAALTLARVIRELAANARKDGALAAHGRVSVSGRLERDNGTDALGLTWQEQGGAPVHGPEGSGVGTTALGRAVTPGHGGQAGVSWREEGLFYELRLPLA